MFDPLQFDDQGNIRTTAPAQANRTSPLPLGNARSGLFAFYTRTFLGLRPTKGSDPASGLRLYASPGRVIIFNMDEDHQGWLTSDIDSRPTNDEELSVHVRSHFYMYSKDMRFLPTSDMEESFEVMACMSQGAFDATNKMVVLDALSTFVGESETDGRKYVSFRNQEELDKHCCAPSNGCDVFGAPKVCIPVCSSSFINSLVRSRGSHLHRVALTVGRSQETTSRPAPLLFLRRPPAPLPPPPKLPQLPPRSSQLCLFRRRCPSSHCRLGPRSSAHFAASPGTVAAAAQKNVCACVRELKKLKKLKP